MAGDFIAEAWAELAIGLFFVCLRLYFRITQYGLREMTWDDFLMVFAAVLYTLETTAAFAVVAVYLGVANNNFTPEQRASMDPKSQLWRHSVSASKTHIFGWFMYTGLFWTLKSCWTIYYSRMTDGVHRMDVRIKLAWVLNAVTYIASICMIMFKCWPLHRQWQINPDPGGNCYPGASKLQVSFVMAINTLTDIYLMAIPLPIIWKARLDTKRKVSLIVLFSGGWVTIIFGILRCATLVSVGPTEPSESGQWSVRESFLAVLVSNAPMVFPLLKRWTYATMGMVSTDYKNSKTASYRLDEMKKPGGTRQTSSSSNMRSGNKKPKRGFQHPLSIPNDTAWGSDEAIVTVNKDGVGTRLDKKISEDSLEMRLDESGGQYSNNRQSKVVGGNGHVGVAHGDILITQEWQVSEEQQARRV